MCQVRVYVPSCFIIWLSSLRDPNSTQTLSAFRGGVEWVRAGKFTQQDIDEAKLSVFSAVDAPVAPSDKGQSFRTPLEGSDECLC